MGKDQENIILQKQRNKERENYQRFQWIIEVYHPFRLARRTRIMEWFGGRIVTPPMSVFI